ARSVVRRSPKGGAVRAKRRARPTTPARSPPPLWPLVAAPRGGPLLATGDPPEAPSSASVACRGGFARAIRGAAASARAKDRPNDRCNRCGRRRSLSPDLPVAGIRNSPKIIYAGRRFEASPTAASRE